MRWTAALFGLAAMSLAGTASASPMTLSPIAFSPEFQVELDEEIGQREGEYLRRRVNDAVLDALARRGVDEADNVAIEISIVDAAPNRPTLQQTRDTPGLDPFRSISIGGAELRAVLRSNDGRILAEVEHSRYDHSLGDIIGPPSTWASAERSIRQFARKVAEAYPHN